MKRFLTPEEIWDTLTKRGKIWHYNIQIDGRRYRGTTGCKDKNQAYQFTLKLFLDIDRASASGNGKIKISQLFGRFEEARSDRSKTYLHDMKHAFDVFIEVNGDLYLSKVKRSHVEALRAFMLKRTRTVHGVTRPVTAYAVNAIMRMLRSAFSYAVEQEWIPKNPFSKFSKVDEISDPPHSYTTEEMHIVFAKMEEIFGRANALWIELYALTGMRLAEWVKVEWAMVDFKNRIMHLPGKDTKKKTGRPVPISGRMYVILKELQKMGLPKPITVHQDTLGHRFAEARDGCRYHRKDWEGHHIPGKHHDFRKTVVTRLRMLGLNDGLRDILLGHKDSKTSIKNYTDYIAALPTVRSALERLALMLLLPPKRQYSFQDAIDPNAPAVRPSASMKQTNPAS